MSDGGNDHLYEAILTPDGISWSQANAAAEARGCGWHLVTITSAQENAFVYSLVSGNPAFWNCCLSRNSAGPWLGGRQEIRCVSPWEWVTGEPFDYTNWGPREPFCNGERIGLFGYQRSMGPHWNDVPDGFPVYGYVIETAAGADDAPPPPLSVASFSPTRGGNAGTVTITVHGCGFREGAQVRLVDEEENVVVAAKEAEFVSISTLRARLDLADVPAASLFVNVALPTGDQFTAQEPFTVEEGGMAQIWVDIVGREAIRPGRAQTYYILYGNRGNVDAVGVPLWFAGVPNDATLELAFEILPPQPLPLEPVDFSSVPVTINTGESTAVPLLLPLVPPRERPLSEN